MGPSACFIILFQAKRSTKIRERYEDDPKLKAYVMTLQKFEKLLKEGVENGSVNITEKTIETDNIFEL